jgi:hypothetical protein
MTREGSYSEVNRAARLQQRAGAPPHLSSAATVSARGELIIARCNKSGKASTRSRRLLASVSPSAASESHTASTSSLTARAAARAIAGGGGRAGGGFGAGFSLMTGRFPPLDALIKMDRKAARKAGGRGDDRGGKMATGLSRLAADVKVPSSCTSHHDWKPGGITSNLDVLRA